MINQNLAEISEIKQHIHNYPDFPKKGILFRDIMPIFYDPTLFQKTITVLNKAIANMPEFTIFVGIESRGFLLAGPLAVHMKKSFIPARKKGKLPGKLISETYDLEYGTDTIEMQAKSIVPGLKYIIIDDLLATGGTALATAKLIQKHGGVVSGFLFLIELSDLKGKDLLQKNLPTIPCVSIISYS